MEYEPDKRFECPCCGQNWIDIRLERLVRHIEERACPKCSRSRGRRAGEELIITSGYRCEEWNRKVGGSPTSSHLKGLAVDIGIDRSRLRYRVIEAAIRLGFHRIGIGKDFVHLDIDRQKDARVIWVYNH